MRRVFVSDLKSGQGVNEVFLVNRKEIRTARDGKMYVRADFCDRTGCITGNIWDATESLAKSFDNGDYVRVKGRVETYHNTLQLNIKTIEKVDDSSVIAGDFLPQTKNDIDEMFDELKDYVRSIKDKHLRALVESFLSDEEFCRKFKLVPAATQYHHAYLGGLLEHTLSVMRTAVRVMDCYPNLRKDLMLAGIFLHDIGKVREIAFDKSFHYTDEGQLLGHLVIGCSMVEEKARGIEGFPNELLMLLKHLILSHHGEFEYGSPKLPVTPEAIALHYLDNLDAKVHASQRAIDESLDEQSSWTEFNRIFQRRLYKG